MSYSINYITGAHKGEWDELVTKNHYTGFQQTFAWSDFLEKTGWKSYKIGLFDEKNHLVAGCFIYKFYYRGGFNMLHIPEGPVLNYENIELAKKQWNFLKPFIFSFIDLGKYIKTTHLRLEARIEQNVEWLTNNFKKAPWSLSPRSTQIINLEDRAEILLAQMKPKTRYNINLAKKKGVHVVKFDLKNRAALKQFYILYQQTAEKKQYVNKKIGFFKALSKKFPHASLFIAYRGHIPLAAAIVIYCGKRSTYLFGGSDYKFRMLMAPYLLHWQIIQDAKSNDFLEYDLWGISKNPEDREDEWHGITKFKRGFGGQQINFLTSLDLIFQETKYQEFVEKFETSS